MTITHLVVSGAVSLMLVASAHPSFVGIAVNEAEICGNCVVDVYATFSDDDDALVAIYGVDFVIDGGFGSLIHSDLLGGSWAPQYSTNPNMDSFCLIGGEADFFNSTYAGPESGLLGFNQLAIPPGAAWLNPAWQSQGQAQFAHLTNRLGEVTWDGYATRMMRLVFAEPSIAGKDMAISGGTIINGQGGLFSFSAPLCAIPAPAVGALLAMAVIVGDQRRRDCL